jgi:prepilin-type N-terminal cleavage/methylation domain-containing protein
LPSLRPSRNRFPAFTLIELLIVVAIIAILAAIAVPNFLEAQVRAKVSRAHADMRTLAMLLETYAVDNSMYPQAEVNGTLKYLWQLSTPVAYCANSNFDDPFTPHGPSTNHNVTIATLRYFGFSNRGYLDTHSSPPSVAGQLYSPRTPKYGEDDEDLRILWFLVFCHGPNGVIDNLNVAGGGRFVRDPVMADPKLFVSYVYDPSNGTVSPGEIFRSGGSPVGATAAVGRFVTDHE